MLSKLYVFVLISIFTCSMVLAQESPPTEPKAPASPERAPAALAFSMAVGGSYLGVQTRDVSKENMAEFGLTEVRGVAIQRVLDDSPAAGAGLLKNDVIIRFNGETVTSVRKLTRLVGEVAPDHTVRITILRNGAELEFSATLSKREMPQVFDGNFKFEGIPSIPEMPEMPGVFSGELPNVRVFPAPKPGEDGGVFFYSGSNRQIGVSVSSLTKQLGDYFGAADGKGLLINNVREDSPAARAGLRAGDIIVEIEGKPVDQTFDLMRVLNEKKEGNVTLTIIRDRNRQTVTVTPEASKEGSFEYREDLERLFKENSNRIDLRALPRTRSRPLVYSTVPARIL